ncbi:MAG: transposase [Flammeovirgaceae bacterium]|nr:transposase [Flammeovirgaceae bacterium]
MSRKYKIRDQEAIYFITFAVVNWIDVFTRRIYRDILIDSIRYCQKEKGLLLYAYCIMSNHVHMIIGRKGENKLEDIIRDLKKFTASKILKTIEENKLESRREWMLWMFQRAGQKNSNNTKYQFWRQDNHPIELSDHKQVNQKLEYIHHNPVEAGIVLSPEEYLYSSAKNYAGIEKILEVELIN